MAKSRVAPVKKISLPRLELLAAVVNSRLLHFIVDSLNNLKISRVLCWTDSSITLYWIKRPMLHGNHLSQTGCPRFTTTWEPSLWQHCPGETNPGDATTRGQNILKLVDNNFWWNGPSWLKMPQESWPVNPSLEPSKAEAKKERKKVVQVNAAIVRDTVIDPSRYSKWSKLLQVTAYVLLFIIKACALAKIKKQQSVAKEPKAGKVALTTEDLINSEYFWYQRI